MEKVGQLGLCQTPQKALLFVVYVQDEKVSCAQKGDGFFDGAVAGDCDVLDKSASFKGTAVGKVQLDVMGGLLFKQPQRQKEGEYH